jgi:Lactonase, 7-bladed beta-propeller
MRLHYSVYLSVVGSALLLSSCGNSTHNPIVCAGANTCVLQNFVYATTSAGQVLVFPVSQNGALQPPTSVPGPPIVGGNIAISPSSRELFVADHVLDTLSAFVLNGNQYLAAPGSPYPAGSSRGGFLEGVTTTPNGKFVYVVGFGGTVSGFSIASNGSLAVISGSPFSVPLGSVEAVTDAASKFLFVVNSSSVSAFTIDSTTGALTAAGQPVALPASILTTTESAATSPTGNFLYVALTQGNSVAAFSFDSTTGALTAVPRSPFAVGSGPNTVTMTPATLYVMDSLDGRISALAWDKATGALTEISGSPFPAEGTSGDIATLNGQYLYATRVNNLISPNTDAIAAFTIDSSGGLSPLAGSPFPAGVPLSGGIATSAAVQ